MPSRTGRIVLHLSAALLFAAPAAMAETRQALVIADRAPGQEPGQPGRDALAVSRALLAAGFDVRRLENPPVLPEPPAEPPDVMLIYLSGDLSSGPAGPIARLSSGAIDLTALAARYPARTGRILLAETCPTAATSPVAGGSNPLPEPPADTLIAALPDRAACGGAERLTSVLLEALDMPGADLAETLADSGLPLRTGTDWRGFQALAPQAEPERGQTVILDQPLRPVSDSQSGIMPAASRSIGGGVQILPAAAPARPLGGDRQARPTAAGLPEPSIIVGERPRPGQDDGSLQGTALGTGFAERNRIRQDDPQLYASLLESGAFDPPAGQMAAAIQTELQRMNCYRAGVDGVWGNGSRQAVDRYFQQAGGAATSREAELALFRQILQRDDVRCPDPVVRQPVAAPQQTRSVPRQTSRTVQQPARQPAPRQQAPAQPAPQPAPSQGLNPNALGTGIFR